MNAKAGRASLARRVPLAAYEQLKSEGFTHQLAKLLASRGVSRAEQMRCDLGDLLSPDALLGLDQAVTLLTDTLLQEHKICVIADYDCDGATACAIALRGLRALGASIDYLVPNRFEHGYGLQPSIVALCLNHPHLGRPDLLLTVDNGIASVDGVAAAKSAGLRVLVTDHHLAGATRPEADAIVNPNQGQCPFPSKALAGCGVMFYVLIALRSHLRKLVPEAYPAARQARARALILAAQTLRLDPLLDLVALGTVADLVPLDQNNRVLVQQGLQRIRRGLMQPGIECLINVSGRDRRRLQASDLGFAIGPRINAAGRLDDMSLGIECLSSDDPQRCQSIAVQLDHMNRERRGIETQARDAALAQLGPLTEQLDPLTTPGHVAYDADWHEGVIGLVASKLKDHLQTPCVVFAAASDSLGQGRLKGSGRSIPGVHLRDCLDWIAKQSPDLMISFGGHAMAAGLSLPVQHLETFTELFKTSLTAIAPAESFKTQLEHDGELKATELSLSTVREHDALIWGQAFPTPLFRGVFKVARQKIVGDKHLSLILHLHSPGQVSGAPLKAILFGHNQALPSILHCLYRLNENQYQGLSELQLMIEHLLDADGRETPKQVDDRS